MKRLMTSVAMATLFMTAAASARDLSYASYMPSSHVPNKHGVPVYFDKVTVATNGEITFKTFFGGAMGGAKELLQNINDGVIDSANVIDIYIRSSLPHSALLSDLSTLGDDPLVFAAAMNEYQLLGCPSCKADLAANNTVGLAWYATSVYTLMCKPVVTGLADLKGLKILATGRNGNLAQDLGGTAVSLTTGEMYEALQRGQVDCVIGAGAWLTSYNIKDSIKSVITYPLGSYFGAMFMNLNADVWDGLSAEQKTAMVEPLPELVADVMFDYLAEADDAFAEAKAAGVTLADGPEDFVQAVQTYRAAQRDFAVQGGVAGGVPDAGPLIDDFLKVVEKWRGLVTDEVRGDRQAYADVLRREIYSKLDY